MDMRDEGTKIVPGGLGGGGQMRIGNKWAGKDKEGGGGALDSLVSHGVEVSIGLGG